MQVNAYPESKTAWLILLYVTHWQHYDPRRESRYSLLYTSNEYKLRIQLTNQSPIREEKYLIWHFMHRRWHHMCSVLIWICFHLKLG